MYGKVLRVSEYELKFGAKEQKVNVFICFKSLKSGDNYVVYSKEVPENDGKIYYGMLHLQKNKIVSMEPKFGSEEIIKELVWKIINNQSLDDYNIFKINNIDKIEIINSKSLDMKKEVVSKLMDLTIPKKLKKEEEDNKSGGHGCLIFLIIMLILGVGGLVLYDKINKTLGLGQELICEKNDADTKINAFINKKISMSYNRVGEFDKLTENTSYSFNNYDNYFNFREKGVYFNYMPSNNDDSGIKWDDNEYIFRTIITMGKDDEYIVDQSGIAVKGNIDDDMAIFQNFNYVCKKQKREE